MIFVEDRDERVDPLGARGLVEIGAVGVVAVANAVFHSAGQRVLDFPVTKI